jgi:transposase
MKHLNILPEGYIYPKEQRAVRDLLRRRLFFVGHRTANILSLQSTITRNLGIKMSSNDIKNLNMDDVYDLFDSSNLVFMAQNNISTIEHLGKIIKGIEKEVKPQVQLRKEFKLLLTIPGIGIILGLTIMLEVGDIARFFKAGNYSSYSDALRPPVLANTTPIFQIRFHPVPVSGSKLIICTKAS